MKTINYKKIVLSLGVLSTLAYGGNYSNYDYMDDRKIGYEKYKVISSTPITKEITKRVRVGDEIRDRVVNKRVPCQNRSETNSIGLDTIIGTVAGIAIGNQFHNHKDAAKVIGGLGGGYLANQMRNSGGDCYEQRVIQDVIPKYDTITESIITGYNNCVEVDGKKLCKESKKRRKYLKIKKTYSIY